MKKWIYLQTNSLQVEEAFAFLQTPEAGGVNIFVGTTRQWTKGRETVNLEYDCYEAMALKEMDRIAEDAGRRWPVVRVCILHRLGMVPLAEASVIIGVATPHRADAFEACRFLIDSLKQQVPIWKRELYVDGQTEWIEGTQPPALRKDDRTGASP
ncbi:MAG: molybdenum cofactor biosynthesis protein MoaE [Rhodothermales bacterium]